MIRWSEAKYKHEEIIFERKWRVGVIKCQKQEKDIKLRVVSNIHLIRTIFRELCTRHSFRWHIHTYEDPMVLFRRSPKDISRIDRWQMFINK